MMGLYFEKYLNCKEKKYYKIDNLYNFTSSNIKSKRYIIMIISDILKFGLEGNILYT